MPLIPLITAAVVAVFGGLTLWLQDETFIKMKPTIVQALFAAILLGGLLVDRPLLKPLLGKMMPPMSDRAWRRFTLRYALFFIAMALLNEVVWRTQSTDFWVTFKVFGLTGLTILFILTQMPFIARETRAAEAAQGGATLGIGAPRACRGQITRAFTEPRTGAPFPRPLDHHGSTTMDQDRKEGAVKKTVGKVKEKAGEITGDRKTEAEGRRQRAEGEVQNTYGSVKDKAREQAGTKR